MHRGMGYMAAVAEVRQREGPRLEGVTEARHAIGDVESKGPIKAEVAAGGPDPLNHRSVR